MRGHENTNPRRFAGNTRLISVAGFILLSLLIVILGPAIISIMINLRTP
jgi:hypothetical protein